MNTFASPLQETGRSRLLASITYRYASDPLQDSRSRSQAFRSAWRMFVTNPISGIGIGNFADEHQSWDEASLAPPLSHAHNLPLKLLSDNGLVGMIVWVV